MAGNEFENLMNKPLEEAAEDYLPPEEIFTDEEWDEQFDELNQLSDTDKLDLRKELFQQMHLLKALRRHLVTPQGAPRRGTELKDIRSYMMSSVQLLTMLQKLEDALNTDADFKKVETAIEMAMEDCSCPEFVKILTNYIKNGGSTTEELDEIIALEEEALTS